VLGDNVDIDGMLTIGDSISAYNRNLVIGQDNEIVSGSLNILFGSNNIASGFGAKCSIGNYNTIGVQSLAIGQYNYIPLGMASTLGWANTAGQWSFAAGYLNTTEEYAGAIGSQNTAGVAGFAAGLANTAGEAGIALGVDASGADYSFVYSTSGDGYFDRAAYPNTFNVRAISGTYFETPNFEITNNVNIGGSLSADSIFTTEIHSISSYTHYQDILISELSGFSVTGDVDISGNVDINGIAYTSHGAVSGNEIVNYQTMVDYTTGEISSIVLPDISLLESTSGNWNSVYTIVQANSALWEESTDISYLSAQIDLNTSDITNIASASANWEATYATVSSGAYGAGDTIDINYSPANYTAYTATISGHLSGINYEFQDINSQIAFNTSDITNIASVSADWNFAYSSLSNFVHLSGDTMDGELKVPSISSTSIYVDTLTSTTIISDEYYLDNGANVTSVGDSIMLTPATTAGVITLSGDVVFGEDIAIENAQIDSAAGMNSTGLYLTLSINGSALSIPLYKAGI
jgi:hypothetical protein